jgi:hypothetical protein
MALSADDQAYFRAELGTSWEEIDPDVESRMLRLQDRSLVVAEVRKERYADLLNAPASFTVVGEYSQDNRANMDAIKAQLGASTDVRIVSSARKRVALDTEEMFVRGQAAGSGR